MGLVTSCRVSRLDNYFSIINYENINSIQPMICFDRFARILEEGQGRKIDVSVVVSLGGFMQISIPKVQLGTSIRKAQSEGH